MKITDDDGGGPSFNDQLIDEFTTPVIPLSLSTGFTNQMTFAGAHSIASVTLSFQVECDTDFYGSNCATFCQDTDDESGHYLCNGDGSKVCLPGYQNPQTDCTEGE